MFKFIAVPADEEGCRFYLERYKPFRLASLQLDADAFKSTYAREIAFDDEAWLNRIRNPLATTFVAVRAGNSEQVVASASLMGPLPSVDANPTGNSHQVISETADATNEQDHNSNDKARCEPLRFEMAAVYTHLEVRRQGLAKSLIKAAAEEARNQARRAGRPLTLVAVVYAANDAAIATYERCGFVRSADGPGLGPNRPELEMYFQAS